jgi:hypothetical protein
MASELPRGRAGGAAVTSIEEKIGNLEARMTNVESRVETANDKLDKISETLATAKGGWRMLLMVGGAVAAVVAVIAGIANLFGWHK